MLGTSAFAVLESATNGATIWIHFSSSRDLEAFSKKAQGLNIHAKARGGIQNVGRGGLGAILLNLDRGCHGTVRHLSWIYFLSLGVLKIFSNSAS